MAGRQFPVCARCSGLYLGVALGLLGWFLVRRLLPVPLAGSRRLLAVLAIAAAPTTVSWVTGVTGIWDGTNVIRAVLALPLGLGAGAVVAAVAAKDLR